MALKKNIVASYVSQIYITVIGIAMLPVYIKYIGAEAYGLVGFFAMLQAWFNLLDMGLTPTMARQTALYRGGAMDALDLRRLLRALEGIFFGVALLGMLGIIISAEPIATKWLQVHSLSLNEVRNAIMLMGIIIGLRWTSGLYRGAINGFEHTVWLGAWNSCIATFRFVLVIPFFVYVGTSPTEFFIYQLGVAIIELIVLVTKTYHLLPKMGAGKSTPWQWEPLRNVLKFSLSIAFTSSVWVLVTQTDKLVLSKLLPLAEYGYFTLAVLVAGAVMMVSGPISSAILPRMTRLHLANDEAGLIQIYRNATQLVVVIAVPVALVLALFSKQILWAWTGDLLLVNKAAPVLTLYAIGSGILALGAFPYYLQFAKGDLRLHLIGSFLFVLLLIPNLIWATWKFGMIGAGWAWLLVNLIYFLFWVPFVHHRFVRGLHRVWLLKDVVFTSTPVIVCACLAQHFTTWPRDRYLITVQLIVLGLMLLGVSSLSSVKVRSILMDFFCLLKVTGNVKNANRKNDG